MSVHLPDLLRQIEALLVKHEDHKRAAAQAALQVADLDLASSKGSRWSDPQLREWKGDSGTLHQFKWSS